LPTPHPESKTIHENSLSTKNFHLPYNLHQTVDVNTVRTLSSFNESDTSILKSRSRLLIIFLKCYFKVVKKIIQDTVPKTIMHEMVNIIIKYIIKDLISKVYKSHDNIMVELLL